MKSLIISLLSAAILILAGWPTVGHSANPEPKFKPEPEIITDFEGAWYSFPGGLVIQFNGDGSADFGVDTDGTPIGYQAQTWFEGDKLSIRFSNYDGAIGSCRDAIGVYQVQRLEGGNIRFATIDDACQFRSDALNGPADLEFEPVFHPVSF